MADSSIEWTEKTWNPVAGCEAISPGCAHCYAATMTRRLEAMGQADYAGLTTKKHFNGTVRPLPAKLGIPLKWRKPRRVFVNSMSDLFHEDVPDEFIRRVFAVMSLAGQHTFQVLTKRAERMTKWFADDNNCLSACQAEYAVADEYPQTPTGKSRVRNGRAINGTCKGLGDGNYWPLPNVWLGVSVEDQQRADERIPWLLKTPAAVRFLSCEPLLSAVDLSRWLQFQGPEWRYSDDSDSSGRPPIDWVIVGGESGPQARPMHPDWVRSLRDQCQAAGVPFFFKQWGEWAPADEHPLTAVGQRQTVRCVKPEGGDRIIRGDGRFSGDGPCEGDKWMALVGKKKAGRQLDGRTWEAFPRVEVPA